MPSAAPSDVLTGDRDPLRRLYGRRKGHPLRATRQAALDDGLPRFQVALPPAGESLDPAGLFTRPPEAVWLEIGFGGGEHLAALAEAHPGIGFLGCEPFVNGLAGFLLRAQALGLDNVRVLGDDARLLLAALPEASLGRAFLLFPDPWPKSRHHKRRFVQADSLDLLARALADGAEFRVASDIMDYVAWTLRQVQTHAAFRWLAEGPEDWRRRPADWPPSRYEEKALAAGRRPAYLRFQRRPRRGT